MSRVLARELAVLFVAWVFFSGCGHASDASSAGAGGAGGAKSTGASASHAASGTSTGTGKMGGPACGLASAAFCDTFDAPAPAGGRAGDLDAHWWSAGRVAPQGPTGHGGVFPIG